MKFALLLLILGILGSVHQTEGGPQPLRRVARRIAPARLIPIQDPTSTDSGFSTQDQGSSSSPDFSTQDQDSSSSPDFSTQDQGSSTDFSSSTQDQDGTTSSDDDDSSTQDSSSSSSFGPKKCPFGQIPAKSDLGDCYQMSCVTERDCKIIFGVNSTCDRYTRTCGCDSAHRLEPISQRCSQIKSINAPCHDSYDCMDVQNSICSDGTCQCKQGYKPSRDGSQCISSSSCSFNYECESTYGSNSYCDGISCHCSNGYVQSDTGKCDSKSLGSYCSSDMQCGDNANCVASQCACAMNYEAKLNNVDCKQFSCSYNSECTFNRGWANSKCTDGSCQCDSDSGYSYDSSTNKCKANSHLLSSFCTSSGQCGENAYCVNNLCKCQSGYKSKNSMDCKLATCSYDYECTSADWNSKCSFGSCSCADNYYVDYYSQTCTRSWSYYSGGDGGLMASSLGVVGAVSLLSIIVAVVTILIKAKQAQRGRVVTPAARTTAVVTSTAKISLPQKS